MMFALMRVLLWNFLLCCQGVNVHSKVKYNMRASDIHFPVQFHLKDVVNGDQQEVLFNVSSLLLERLKKFRPF